jgi:PHO85 cyclin-5
MITARCVLSRRMSNHARCLQSNGRIRDGQPTAAQNPLCQHVPPHDHPLSYDSLAERSNLSRISSVSSDRPPSKFISVLSQLQDSAAQIVEIIWPLSVVACRGDTALGSKGVLPLRTFIQETLRRSRTSYYTLQVALYYLVMIRPHVPGCNFTMEQPEDGQSLRALQCGRRMFLAALILASKYLQDRNYSARAWSKISGLATHEINCNEMTFLTAVNWRLHISETIFQRWTDIVLKFTPTNQAPPSPPHSPGAVEEQRYDWATIILKLSPELDNVDLETSQEISAPLSPPESDCSDDSFVPVMAPAPTAYAMPRVDSRNGQKLPPIAQLAPLPTPMMTPAVNGFCTPATSMASYCSTSRRPSIGSALANAQSAATSRCAIDRWTSLPPLQGCPKSAIPSPASQYSGYRRSSLAHNSINSSPESMVSDNSSRSSRSSSISSVSSSICAPTQANLAVQATCRNAKLNCQGKRNPMELSCLTTQDDLINGMGSADYMSSPDSYTGPTGGPVPDFSNFCLTTPKVNYNNLAAQEAARSLRPSLSPSSSQTATPTNRSGRKRGRGSEDFSSALQSQVRHLLGTGSCPVSRDSTDADIAVDAFAAMPSFHRSTTAVKLPSSRLSPHRLAVQKDMGRKRFCGDEVLAMPMPTVAPQSGPGMWSGML